MKKTKEEMYILISEWRDSGLTKSDFCQIESIPFEKLAYWITKQNKEKINSDKKPIRRQHSFIPMNLPSVIEHDGFEILYPNGVSLKCPNSLSLDKLQSMIKIY